MSEKKRRPGRYPDEFRERAVRMVLDHQHEYPSQWKAIESIAKKLSVNHETFLQWVRRVETDNGDRPGVTTDERARITALERENRELRRANDILKAASAFFGAELDRQSAIVPPLVAATVLASSKRAAASLLDGVSRSSDGLPGAALFTQILSWGFWLALGVCGLAILYGAATWRGMNGNSGRGVEGKMYVAAGAIGAMVIGLEPTIVRVLFDAGQAG